MQTSAPAPAWLAPIRASRWRVRAAAIVAGAASILAMAPFFIFPVLWITLPLLLWLVDDAERDRADAARFAPWQRSGTGRAAEVGWWFGFGYHVAGLFWIGEAFLVEADTFGWLLPFAVTGLPAGLALFTAAATAATTAMAKPGLTRVLAAALAFGLTEWMRGHILTGFPWNVLGYALTAPPIMQGAALFGIYGLTVIAVIVFALPPLLWQRRSRTAAIAIALLPLAGLALYRAEARASYHRAGPATDAPLVRIVQPSVRQRDKWRAEHQRRIFDDHLDLSLTAPDGRMDGARDIALIVWPEAAMPFVPLAEPVALADIGRMLPSEASLASGALRVEPPSSPGGSRAVYNSLLLFGDGPSARLLASYDKTHLVPFGEYLPLQAWLEAIGLRQLTKLRGGFTAGPEPRPFIDVPRIGLLAPLICYEAIFPARVVQSNIRPRAMLNVTNDGWFGETTGPHQHLHMARVRAVEEGLPVIRAANNGVSAIIDAFGGIGSDTASAPKRTLGLNVRGTIDARLPPGVSPPPYARWGDITFWILSSIAGLLVTLSRQSRTCVNFAFFGRR